MDTTSTLGDASSNTFDDAPAKCLVQSSSKISEEEDDDEFFLSDECRGSYVNGSESSADEVISMLSHHEKATVQGPDESHGSSSTSMSSFKKHWGFLEGSAVRSVLVFMVSGILASIFFESLCKEDRSSNASFMTSFLLHVYIVLVSLPKAYEYILSPRIPLHKHFMIVVLSYSFVYFKSTALPLLPMPVFIVCTNLQLGSSLLVGRVMFGKVFSWGQCLGVVLVVTGCLLIAYSTSAESSSDLSGAESVSASASAASSHGVLLGLLYMMLSIFSLSVMIPLAGQLVQEHDADVQEQVFMQHLLALPLFWPQREELQVWKFATSVGSWDYSMWSLSSSLLSLSCFYLLGNTVFAQINRNAMMEVSIDLGSVTAQLLGTGTKTVVFLISSLYFNAPPYPPCVTWLGLLTQMIGSILYVKASFSSADDGSCDDDDDESTRALSKRLSRVSWTGDSLFDENILGLSANDIDLVRKATAKHNNRREHNICSTLLEVGPTPLPLGRRTVSDVIFTPTLPPRRERLKSTGT